MSFLLPVSLICLSAAMTPAPMILDTDIGDDIDDTWALCQILGSPQLDLKLIVTASQNTPLKARLVAKMLDRLGRTDIPLGIGKKTEEAKINQQQWLGDYALDQYKGKVHQDGVQALIDAVNASPVPVTLCAIGPLTNLRDALQRDPGIAKKARLVLMAGSVRIGYGGKATPDAEWNVFRDVEASKAVFAAPWDITIAPLDTCGTLKLDGADFARVVAGQTAKCRVVVENYDQWVNRGQYAKDTTSILFDTLAVHLCAGADFLEMETLPIRIDDKGFTVEDKEKGRPVHCALRWKDETGYKQSLIAALLRP